MQNARCMCVCSTKRKKCLDNCKNACGIRACVACGAMHRHVFDSRVRTAPFLHNQGCMSLMQQVYLSHSAALSEPVFTGSFVAFTFIRLRYKYVSIKMAEVQVWQCNDCFFFSVQSQLLPPVYAVIPTLLRRMEISGFYGRPLPDCLCSLCHLQVCDNVVDLLHQHFIFASN